MLALSSDPIIEITADALSHLKGLLVEAEQVLREPAFTIISWAEIGSMPVNFPLQGTLTDEVYAEKIKKLYDEYRPHVTTEFKMGVGLERLSALPEQERLAVIKTLDGVPIAIDVESFFKIMPKGGLVINIDPSTRRLHQEARLPG